MASKPPRTQSGQFVPGKSGNPAGRPKGKMPQTILREQLAKHGHEIIERVVKQALAGDTQAMAICVDRLIPRLKPSAETVNINLEGAQGLAGVSRRIVDEAAAGRIPGDVASQLVGALGGVARIVEIDELERRLAALESQNPATKVPPKEAWER